MANVQRMIGVKINIKEEGRKHSTGGMVKCVRTSAMKLGD